jgi:hypothetical protein
MDQHYFIPKEQESGNQDYFIQKEQEYGNPPKYNCLVNKNMLGQVSAENNTRANEFCKDLVLKQMTVSKV